MTSLIEKLYSDRAVELIRDLYYDDVDAKESFYEAFGNKILEKANNYNIAAGIHIVQPSKVELDKRIEEGYKFIAYSIDTVFLNTISNFKNYA